MRLLTFFITMLFGFMLFTNQAFAQSVNPDFKDFKPFKMAFIPDVHLSFNQKDDWILYNESLVILQDVIKTLNNEPDLNFVVFGGNLIHNKDQQLYDLPTFSETATELKVPYLVIPGDRDVDLIESLSKHDFCTEFLKNGFENNNKTYWAIEPVPNVVLIGLDTTVLNSTEGVLTPVELEWLDNTLSSNKDKFTIIVMHHGALPACDQDLKAPWNKLILNNSSDFLGIIKKYPQVKVVLSGHHHLNSTKISNNTLFIQTPSIAAYPNQFKMLTFYPDRVEIKNEQISYKQLVKKAKQAIINTDYAHQYNLQKPKEILKLQEGDKYSQDRTFYYNSPLK